jgi:hypothetical protein
MGVKDVYLFYVHINRAGGPTSASKGNDYTPQYKVVISKKLSVNLQHLLQLFQAFSGGSTPAKNTPALATAPAQDAEFGGGHIDIQFRPSDIVVTSLAFRTAPAAPPVAAGGAPNDSGPSAPMKLGDDVTFDNEGKYYYDFSLAVPVRRIGQVKYEATNGSFSPVNFDSTNVFVMADGFIPAADVKSGNWTRYPHPVAGVAFAKQPLSKILVGGAWGAHFSELYLGILFVKQPRTAANSSSCSNSGASTPAPAPFGYHYCRQFSIGLNLPVTGFVNKLTAPK